MTAQNFHSEWQPAANYSMHSTRTNKLPGHTNELTARSNYSRYRMDNAYQREEAGPVGILGGEPIDFDVNNQIKVEKKEDFQQNS